MFFLVVDDDALSRDLLTLLLKAEGYEVETAASGEAAVARVATCALGALPLPEVVLTDIQMPGLAGHALAAALKPLLTPGTPLVAMSGSQPLASALTCFDGFLLKPFQVSELRSMIEGALKALPTSEPVADALDDAVDDALDDALDGEIYEKMSELMPPEQLGQMYALCLDDARKRIAHMQDFAAAGDDTRYRSEAHAVKGGCGMIGAKGLYALAAAAEENGLAPRQATSRTTCVTAVLAQLSLACDRLERILQERTR